MNGGQILENINRYLSYFRYQVENSNAAALFNINILAEVVLIPILNEVFDCDLENANTDHANFPAVDLIDLKNRIAIQVTSTPDSSKIRKTLTKFFENKQDKDFDKLFVYVISKRTENYTVNFDDLVNNIIDFDVNENVIDHTTILKMLKDEITDIEKLKRIEKVLADQFSNSGIDRSSKFLNSFADYALSSLVGRSDSILYIREHFNNSSLLLLSGMGGIGKSVIAKAYIKTYKDQYESIVYLENVTSLKDTIIQQLGNLVDGFEVKDNLNLDQNLNILAGMLRNFSNALLVIDNCNDRVEIRQIKSLLESIGWKVLIVSRSKVDSFKDDGLLLEIETLTEDESLTLFQKNFRKLQDDEVSIVRKILRIINYHTKLIILIAKAAHRNKLIDLETIAEKVSKNNYTDSLNVKVELELEERKVYEFILLLFNTELLNESQGQILRFFSVLPSQDISTEYLRNLIMANENNENDFVDILVSLVQEGWLESSDYIFFRIHPLIQLVSFNKLKPDVFNCQLLFDKLVLNLSVDRLENLAASKKYLIFLEAVLSIFNHEKTESVLELFEVAALTYNNIGRFQEALKFYEEIVKRTEKTIPINEYELIKNYNNLASTYRKLDKNVDSIKFSNKAIEILSKNYSPENATLDSKIFNNLAITYKSIGNIPLAFQTIQQLIGRQNDMLSMLEERIENSKFKQIQNILLLDLSNSYLNAASICRSINTPVMHEQAMRYDLEAIKIREKYLHKDHPDLAYSYNNTAVNYRNIGKYGQALFYHKKAIDIRTKIYAPGHPEITTSFGNRAQTYLHFGKYDLAVSSLLEAFDSANLEEPINKLSLLRIYKGLAENYLLLKDYLNHEKYIILIKEIE